MAPGRSRLATTALLAAIALAGCTEPSYTTTTTTTSASFTATPLPESLSWTGRVSGHLTQAYATCHLYPGFATDAIVLRNRSDSIDIEIPVHAEGVMKITAVTDVGLHLDTSSGGSLYLAISGSVTYSKGGDSGSLNVALAQQLAGPLEPAVLRLTGDWRCR